MDRSEAPESDKLGYLTRNTGRQRETRGKMGRPRSGGWERAMARWRRQLRMETGLGLCQSTVLAIRIA